MIIAKRFRRGILVMLSALGMVVGAASAAQAHDQLIGSNPAANESVASAPESIVLEFNNSILNTGSVIQVTNMNGEAVTNGTLTVADRTVSQPLIADLPNGQYRVVWRVVSSDGHPIEDAFQFAIGEPVGPFEPTETPTPEPTQTATAEPDVSAEAMPVSSVSGETDSPVLRVALIALIGAAVGAGVYALLVLQRKRTKQTSSIQSKDQK